MKATSSHLASGESVSQAIEAGTELRLQNFMSHAVTTTPLRISKSRQKHSKFRALLGEPGKTNIGAWHAAGWPPEDMSAAEEYFAKIRETETPAYYAHFIKNATVVGPHLAVASGEFLVAESVRSYNILIKKGWYRPGQRPFGVRLPTRVSVRHLDGLVVPVGSRASGAFFHWMVEILPRLLLSAVISQELGGTLLLLQPERNYQTETLRALLDSANVVYTEPAILHCEEVAFVDHVFLQLPTHRALSPQAAIAFDALLSAFGHVNVEREKGLRIYVSRRDAARRHVLNEQDLDTVFEALGFTVVTLSDMSVAQQAHLFRRAEMVMGLHGAGLTNIGFCFPGTPVIEILPAAHRFVSPYYMLAGLRGLPYICLGAEPSGRQENGLHGDFFVEPSHLVAAVNIAEKLT